MSEVVLAFPPQVAPIRHVRSTLLIGSLGAIKQAGYLDAWAANIDPTPREELLQAVAGVWIPVDRAIAHYRACDSLGLSPDAEAQLGGATFDRVRGTLLGTMLRMANGAGVTPWTLLPRLQRFWDRAYDGAGIQIVRLGPKDAQLDLMHCAFADTRYYRNALRGLVVSVLQLFCQKAYVQERKARREAGTVSFRAQWA